MFLRCTNSCRSCLGTRPATYYIHEQGGGGGFRRRGILAGNSNFKIEINDSSREGY